MSSRVSCLLQWLLAAALLLSARAQAATPGDGHPGAAPLSPSVEALAPGLSRGAFIERVPLDLPPAPGGVVPGVALVHDPAVREGWMGFGWTLSGASRVERRSDTGGVPGFGWGQPAGSDTYRLDGVDLVYTSTTGCWEPEVWDGSCLSFDAADNTWTWRRRGWSRVYGGGDATWGPIDAPGPENTAAWFIVEERGPVGEPILWTWQIDRDLGGTVLLDAARGLPRPTRVDYGQAGELLFEYEQRPDPRLDASSGAAGVSYRRLVAVEARHAKQLYSRVSLGYLDQADYPSSAAAMDCDGQPISADPAPAQVLLQRVVREASSGARYGAGHKVLRCAATADEPDAWAESGADWASALPLPLLDALEADQQISLRMHPMRLNGDSLPDLLVIVSACDEYPALSSNNPADAPLSLPSQTLCASEAAAYINVATHAVAPGLPHSFGLVEDSAWTSRLNAWLSAEPGVPVYALGDLDRDGWGDLLISEAGVVRRVFTDPASAGLSDPVTGLSPSALARAQLVDLDGDGLPDLVTPAWENAQGHLTTGSWRRNTGSSSGWFDAAEPMSWPLESASYGAEGWPAASACSSAYPYSAPLSAAYNPEAWRARNSRLAELNGDGLVDVAMSFHACWNAADEPDPSSAFSRVFYGIGGGRFIDSGLSAGAPFDLNRYDSALWPRSAQRLPGGWAGAELFSALDLDRSGHPSLLQWGGAASDGRAELWAAADRGLIEGFSLNADPLLAAPAELNTGLNALAATYPWLEQSVLADFNGDGFPDQLIAELIPPDPSDPIPTLEGATWQVRYRSSQRDTTQGRLIELTGPWGGVTELGWGFTGEYPEENPELGVNLEVLRTHRGEAGLRALRYRSGWHDGERLRGFAVVEAIDALGTTLHGFDLSHISPGGEVYAARLFSDGSIAAATLSLYGQLNSAGGWFVDTWAPYFNPLARRCELELLAGNSESVASLLEQCASAEGAEPVSAAAIAVRSGFEPWMLPSDLSALADAVTGGEASAAFSLGGLQGPSPALDFSDLPASIGITESRSVATEHPWTLPELPEAPAEPQSGPLASRMSATSWRYDSSNQLLEVLHHRDLSTAADDLEQHYSWHPFNSQAWGAALQEVETTGPGGSPTWSRVERLDLHPGAFDLPRALRQWGTGSDYVELSLDYSATGPLNGQVQRTTWPDGSVEEARYSNTCGGLTEQVDRVGRVRELTLDSLCRVAAESFEGARTTRSFDAFHRVLLETTDPDVDDPGDADLLSVEHAYADDPGESLRQLSLHRSGRLVALELDGWGRPTTTTTCMEGSGLPWAWGSWSCEAAGPVRVKALLWGSDGQLAATVAPHLDGEEDPEIATWAWDLLGREAAVSEPSPAGGRALSSTVRGPGFTEHTDALGVTTTTTFDSLSSETTRAGVLRAFELRDPLGRVEEHQGADGVITTRTYDSLNRLYTEALQGDPGLVGTDHACEPADGDWPVEQPCAFTWTHSYDIVRGEHSVVDPAGVTTTTTLDSAGRVVSREVDGVQVLAVSFLDRAPNRPAEVRRTDAQGAQVTEVLDGLGRPLEVLDLDGATAYSWGPSGLERVDSPAGRSVHLEHDLFGQLVATCLPSGLSGDVCASPLEARDYTGAGLLAWSVDADGVESSFQYAPGGLLEEALVGDALVYEAEYDVLGRLSTEWEGPVERRYTYDEWHRIERVEEGPAGAPLRWQQLTWGGGDRLESRELGPVDSGSLYSSFEWHALGWLRQVEHPDGAVERFHYDALGRERFAEHEAGALSRTRYDSQGRVVALKRPGQGPRSIQYSPNTSWDGLSELLEVAVTDGEGQVSRSWLDGAGRLVGQEDPTGLVERHRYSAGERWATEVRDPAGTPLALKVWLYEAETGRLSAEWGWLEAPYSASVIPQPGDFGVPGPADYLVEYAHTAAGRLAEVRVGEELTTYSYSQGRLDAELWDGGLRGVSHSYDAYGQLSASFELGSDGSERATTYSYDALGRLSGELIDDGASTLELTTEGYDARDLPSVLTRSWDGVTESVETWTWSDRGLPLSRELDVGGALLTTTWGWTADGQLSTLGLPSGRGSELVYTLSGADHLPERLLDAGGSTLVELLTRDGELRPTALEFDGRRLKLFYDALGRPIERSWDAGSSWAGHWDDRGRLDTESYVDPASDWTADYSYAEPGWLEQEVITESGSQDPWVREYSYDAGGRRESVSDDAGLLRELGWSGALPEAHDGVVQPVDPWDALAQDPSGAALSRDPSGALSDRLTASGELTSWSRDPSGLPVLSMEPDGDRWTTWGLGGALPLEVQTPTEDIQNIVFEGLWLGQVREGGAVEGALTVLSDPRGSLLNLGGEALGPHGAFGERASAPSGFDERFVYAGLERLPDGGLMLARHRAMLPEQGVFDRPDPLGLGGGLHRARYAENNPLGFVDPLGFTAQPVTGSSGTWSAGVGGVGGGVGGVQDPCRNGVEACGSWEKAKRLGGVVYARGGDEGDEDEDAEEEVGPLQKLRARWNLLWNGYDIPWVASRQRSDEGLVVDYKLGLRHRIIHRVAEFLEDHKALGYEGFAYADIERGVDRVGSALLRDASGASYGALAVGLQFGAQYFGDLQDPNWHDKIVDPIGSNAIAAVAFTNRRLGIGDGLYGASESMLARGAAYSAEAVIVGVAVASAGAFLWDVAGGGKKKAAGKAEAAASDGVVALSRGVGDEIVQAVYVRVRGNSNPIGRQGPFNVTPQGVVVPPIDRFNPGTLVRHEMPGYNGKINYGIIDPVTGKFRETVAIHPKEPGKLRRNHGGQDHYHLNRDENPIYAPE